MPSPLGRPIRVGVFEHDPDAFNCFRLLPHKNCRKPGAEVEIIKTVMELLKWEWEIVDTALEFGVVNDFGILESDGNFSGIMGLLARNDIDMSGLSMRITPERMHAAHFTFPIRYFQQVYIIKRPPENDFRNFIFATFTVQVWLMLLVTILGVAMLRFVIAILIDKKDAPSTNILTSSILETYGIMLKQRVVDPTAASAMVLEAVLIAAMLVVSQYYQSSMNSKLTAPPTSAIPFYHQDELLTLLEQKKTYLTYFANLTLEGSSERNIERIKKLSIYNPVITHENENDLIAEIKRGGVFFSTYDVEFLPQTISSWDRKQGLTVILDTAGIISYTAFGFSLGNRALCRIGVTYDSTKVNNNYYHCHDESSKDNLAKSKKAIRVLWMSLIICLFFMTCEIIGGFWANSLAIVTDAAHLLTDFASMLISLFSIYIATKKPSQRMSFGFYRAEVLGAFFSVFLIWIVTGVLVVMAIMRMINRDYEIDSTVMAITATIGVCVNLIMGVLLYFGGHSHSHLGGGHGHEDAEHGMIINFYISPQGQQSDEEPNINVRAAFIHVLGDLIQSVGVLIAALIIYFNEDLLIMDPICTLIFSVIVLCTTIYILKDAMVVLLEGRPNTINFSNVFSSLEQINGVKKVHDLRIWALTMDKLAVSVHLEVAEPDSAQSVLRETRTMLQKVYNVHESTIQIEGFVEKDCGRCDVPK
ncbi:unnamed protein product [Strongylus vulgaris]|uniref:Uncharacterized protein n=1 Tax=Strongylus vulgaris TaxID=40348 RepID=A0A3P7KX98_STRVU|nr:unnamed protein product [Strongylus vulgaris]